MKNLSKYLGVPLMGALLMTGLSNCAKHNQVLDLATAAIPATTSGVGDTLFCMHVPTGPYVQPVNGAAWDGSVDPIWNDCKKLAVHAVVPDLGNGTFSGYIGNATNVTMSSLYDNNYIYYLIEFATDQKMVSSAQWYYNPTTKLWAQEATVPTLTSDGVSYRPSFGQDQFVMMFNINNSFPSFNTLSCYAACHTNTSVVVPGTTPMTGGFMYTNGPTEILDVWRARMLQVVNCNQANDCYIDWGGGTMDKNQVHNDLQVNNGPTPIADGGFSNKQSLKITGKTTKENVPIWVIPSGIYLNSAILLKDTLPGGQAVRVTAVDSFGVLTLANATTIDPRGSTNYTQIGTGDGPKCIPGSILASYTGSRGDVSANAFYTGTGWRLLLRRALKTTDAVNDVDFSTLKDQPFGIGAMFNGADNEHAIVAGLTLRFQK
jgi:hypothetical protein